MALLLPLLILMVDGVVEVSLLMHNQSVLLTATQQAARAGLVAGSPKMSTTDIGNLALNYCQENLIGVANGTLPVVEVTQALVPAFGLPLQVQVSYPFQGFLVTGFLSAFQDNRLMTAMTVMYNE
jgi:Flp pilus assembly protein TadG